jgi:hypothetical protein
MEMEIKTDSLIKIQGFLQKLTVLNIRSYRANKHNAVLTRQKSRNLDSKHKNLD